MLFCLKTETELASDSRAYLKNWTVDKLKKRKVVSVNFSHTLLSFLTTLGDAGRGLDLRAPVQCFVCEFNMTSHM